MAFVLQIIDTAIPGLDPGCEGMFIVDYKEDDYGTIVGLSEQTSDAKQFEAPHEAMQYWQQQSEIAPLRPDGMPNRPLTAYTVCVERA